MLTRTAAAIGCTLLLLVYLVVVWRESRTGN